MDKIQINNINPYALPAPAKEKKPEQSDNKFSTDYVKKHAAEFAIGSGILAAAVIGGIYYIKKGRGEEILDEGSKLIPKSKPEPSAAKPISEALPVKPAKSTEKIAEPEIIKEKPAEANSIYPQKEVSSPEQIKIKAKTPPDIKTYEDLQEIYPFSKKEPTLTELQDGVKNKTILISFHNQNSKLYQSFTNTKEHMAKVELHIQNSEKDLHKIEECIPALEKKVLEIESEAENMNEIEKAGLKAFFDDYNKVIANIRKSRIELETRKNELKNMKEEIELIEPRLTSYFKPNEFNGRKYYEVFDGKGKRIAITDIETSIEYNFNNPEKTLNKKIINF